MKKIPSFISDERYDSQFLRRIAELNYLLGPGKYAPEGEILMEIADKIDLLTGELPKSDPKDAQEFFKNFSKPS